jgi:hypothetical protein
MMEKSEALCILLGSGGDGDSWSDGSGLGGNTTTENLCVSLKFQISGLQKIRISDGSFLSGMPKKGKRCCFIEL